MNKFGKITLSVLFILYIFIVGLYKVMSPDQYKSEVENRRLAQKPELTIKSFITGAYMKDFENYFTDQFPGRNVWLNAYINYQRATNKTYIYDFYVNKDNFIIPKPSYSSHKEEMNYATLRVNNFANELKTNGIEFYYFVLPHKATMLQFLYPAYINKSSSIDNINYFISKLDHRNFKVVNMVESFKEFTEDKVLDMYFKTDHHWNINGAFEGYKVIANVLSKHSNHARVDFESLNEDYYEKVCVPENKPFKGTYNRQIYMSVESDDNEKMCTLINHDLFSNYEVYIGTEKVDPFDVYANAMDNYKTKNYIYYGDIFSNDLREINIVNNHNKKAGNILVLKDSYANPMIYHIAQNFHKTTVYDIRHNKDRTVEEYIKQNDFDVVVVLYNSTQLRGEMFNFDSVAK